MNTDEYCSQKHNTGTDQDLLFPRSRSKQARGEVRADAGDGQVAQGLAAEGGEAGGLPGLIQSVGNIGVLNPEGVFQPSPGQRPGDLDMVRGWALPGRSIAWPAATAAQCLAPSA